MSLTKITASDARVIRMEIDQALQNIATKYGLNSAPLKVRFSETMVSGNFAISLTDLQSLGESKETLFKALAPQYGLRAEDYGDVFTFDRKSYKIIGIRPNASKNILEIERLSDKKTFFCPVAYYYKGR